MLDAPSIDLTGVDELVQKEKSAGVRDPTQYNPKKPDGPWTGKLGKVTRSRTGFFFDVLRISVLRKELTIF